MEVPFQTRRGSLAACLCNALRLALWITCSCIPDVFLQCSNLCTLSIYVFGISSSSPERCQTFELWGVTDLSGGWGVYGCWYGNRQLPAWGVLRWSAGSWVQWEASRGTFILVFSSSELEVLMKGATYQDQLPLRVIARCGNGLPTM